MQMGRLIKEVVCNGCTPVYKDLGDNSALQKIIFQKYSQSNGILYVLLLSSQTFQCHQLIIIPLRVFSFKVLIEASFIYLTKVFLSRTIRAKYFRYNLWIIWMVCYTIKYTLFVQINTATI